MSLIGVPQTGKHDQKILSDDQFYWPEYIKKITSVINTYIFFKFLFAFLIFFDNVCSIYTVVKEDNVNKFRKYITTKGLNE